MVSDVKTYGDSNSFLEGIEAEERRSDGAPRGDAPKEIRTVEENNQYSL